MVSAIQNNMVGALCSYYHSDRQFNVRGLTNQSGNVVELYSYNPYGKQTIMDATGTEIMESANGNCYGYTGRYLDEETGMWYFRARYYDNEMGRFISRDPLGYVDGLGLYNGYFAEMFGLDPWGKICNDVRVTIPISQKLGNAIENNPGEYIDPKGEVVWVGKICINCKTGAPTFQKEGIEGPASGKILINTERKNGRLVEEQVGSFEIKEINVTKDEPKLEDCPCPAETPENEKQKVYSVTFTFTVQASVAIFKSPNDPTESVKVNVIAGSETKKITCKCEK